MLDFYLTDNLDVHIEEPDKNNFIGSLKMEDVEQINTVFKQNSIPFTIEYFNDQQLEPEKVNDLKASLAHISTTTSKVQAKSLNKFIDIIKSASSERNGLITFCD